MGGLMSLEKIQNDFPTFVAKCYPRKNYTSSIYYSYPSSQFFLVNVYDGKIDEQFSQVMPNLIKNYLEENPTPHENIAILTGEVIYRLHRDFIVAAIDLTQFVTKYDIIIDNEYFIKFTLDRCEKTANIVAVCHPNREDCQRFIYKNRLNLENVEKLEEIKRYTEYASNIFEDRYLKQFKLLFYDNGEQPFQWLGMKTLNHENSQCLLWLLKEFKYTTEQLREIFKRAIDCDQEVIAYLTDELLYTKQDLLNLAWADKRWRIKLLNNESITIDDLIRSADTVEKQNILLFDGVKLNDHLPSYIETC